MLVQWALVLLFVHAVGVTVAIGAAVWDIETIVGSGPILSASGLMIALVSFRAKRPIGFKFGLAAPTISVFCWFLILAADWGPREAQAPISIILAAIGLPYVASAIFAFREVAQQGQDDRPRLRFQFSIASIFVVMLVIAIPLGLLQSFGQSGAAFGILLAYAVVTVYAAVQFRRRVEEDGNFLSLMAKNGSGSASPSQLASHALLETRHIKRPLPHGDASPTAA